MRHELQLVLMSAKELPAGELPRLLGELEEIRATAMARLTAPAMAQLQQHDELLDTAEAAHRLGISKDFLYRTATFRSPAESGGVCCSPVWESRSILDSKDISTAMQRPDIFNLSELPTRG